MKKLLINTKAVIVTLVVAILGIGSAVLGTTQIDASNQVPIEGTLRVGNATQGIYDRTNVNARIDDVVNVTAWYHNIEDENSGRIAENVNVRINLPGAKTRAHQITSRVGGSNTNVIDNIAVVNTSVDTTLQYIPGTATRRYNAGTNANPNWVIQSIPDSVVTTGYNISRLNPCWNFQETINIQARVMAPVISITKEVKVEGTDGWATTINAEPGTTLAYLITVKNEGNERLTNVIVRDSLPPQLEYVSGSAKLINNNYPNGYALSDNLINGGTNIGNYAPGSGAYVRFNARIPENLSQCGNYRFTNVGVVRADQLGEYYNTAIVNTNNVCVLDEDVNIRIIKFHDRNGNRVQDANEERLSGWSFRVVGPNDFEATTVTDENGVAMITGDLIAGNYTVTEVLQPGWTNTTGISVSRNVTEDPSTQTFTFGNRKTDQPTPPVNGGDIAPTKAPLPVTGPMEAAAATLGTLGLSGSAVAWVRSRKRLLDSFIK